MFLHTMEFKTPEALHARLREAEKIDLRRASEDRVDHLFHTVYRHEIETLEDLQKVKALCDKDMADYTALENLDAYHGRIPSLWRM